MLDYNDNLSQFVQNVRSGLNAGQALQSDLSMLGDLFYYCDIDAGDNYSANDWIDISGYNFASMQNLLESFHIARTIHTNSTTILPNGKVINLRTRGGWNGDHTAYNLYLDVYTGNDWSVWYRFVAIQNPNPHCFEVLRAYDDDTEEDLVGVSLPEFYECLSESITNASIYVRASDLAQRGELNAVSLKSSFTECLSGFTSKNLEIVNTLCDCIDNSSTIATSKSLLFALRRFSGGLIGATGDSGNTITFNNTGYAMDTSILLPFNTILDIASTVLSVFSAIINPVVGLVISAACAGVSTIVKAINDNNNDYAVVVDDEDRGHFGFATPIYQRVVKASNLPTNLLNQLDSKGYIKLVNGLFTVYAWRMEDNDSNVGVEMYINMTFAGNYDDGVEGLIGTIFNHYQSSSNHLSGTTWTRSQMNSTMKQFLQDVNTHPGEGGLLTGWTNTIYSNYTSFGYARLMLALFIVSQICLAITNNGADIDADYSDISVGNYSTDTTFTSSDLNRYINKVKSFIIWVRAKGHVSSSVYSATTAFKDLYENEENENWAFLINNVIPSIKNILSKSDQIFSEWAGLLDNWWLFGESSVIDLNDNTNEHPLDVIGCGFRYMPSFSTANKNNPYFCPPKSKYNVWFRLALTLTVVAAATITAAIAYCKVKKEISYHAAKARAVLANDVENFNSPTITDADGNEVPNPDYQSKTLYNKIYKQSKRYNRFWGKLSGTSYDAFNGWIDYPGSVSSNGSSWVADKVSDATTTMVNRLTGSTESINSNTDDAISDITDILNGSMTSKLNTIDNNTSGLNASLTSISESIDNLTRVSSDTRSKMGPSSDTWNSTIYAMINKLESLIR